MEITIKSNKTEKNFTVELSVDGERHTSVSSGTVNDDVIKGQINLIALTVFGLLVNEVKPDDLPPVTVTENVVRL